MQYPAGVADAYVVGDKIALTTRHLTTQGLPIGSGEIIMATLSDLNLGLKLSAALARSRRSVPHPATAAEWRALVTPILKALKLRSEREIYRKAACVEVKCDGSMLRLTAMQPAKNFSGYVGRPDLVKDLPADAIEEIVSAFIDFVNRARSV